MSDTINKHDPQPIPASTQFDGQTTHISDEPLPRSQSIKSGTMLSEIHEKASNHELS